MAGITLDTVREKFPQYGDMSDADLASALHKKFYADMPADQFNAKIGYEPPEPIPTVGGRLKDAALDVGRGVVGVGKTAVGLASLATGGLAGRAMDAIGYNPNEADETLASGYSPARQAAEAKVKDAKGAWGTAKAMLSNPSTMIGQGIQALPMMPLAAVGAGGMAARVFSGAVKEALEAGATKEAAELAGKAALESAGGKSAVYAGQAGANAAMAAGTTAEDIRAQNPADAVSMYKGALSAGVLTGVADLGLARLPGGSLASSIATKGVVGGTERGIVARSLLTGANQGALGAVMGAAQTGGTNVGTGKNYTEGMGASAVSGALGGAAMGVATGAWHNPHKSQSLVEGANEAAPIADESTPPAPDAQPAAEAAPAPQPAAGSARPGAPATNNATPVGTPRPDMAPPPEDPGRAPHTPEELDRVNQRHGPVTHRVGDDGKLVPGKMFDGQEFDPGPKGEASLQKAVEKVVDEHRNESSFAQDARDAYALAFKKNTGQLPTSKELHSMTDWVHGLNGDEDLTALVTHKIRTLEQEAAKKSEAGKYDHEAADQKMSTKDAREYTTLITLKNSLTGAEHVPENFSTLNRPAKAAKGKPGAGAESPSTSEGAKPVVADQGGTNAKAAESAKPAEAKAPGDAKGGEQVRVPAGPDDAQQKERNVKETQNELQPNVPKQEQAVAAVEPRQLERPVEHGPASDAGGEAGVQGERPGSGGAPASGEGRNGPDQRPADGSQGGAGGQEVRDNAAKIRTILQKAEPTHFEKIIDRIQGMSIPDIAEKHKVSPSTVEKAVSAKSLGPKIRKAAAELGYNPDEMVQLLTKKPKTEAAAKTGDKPGNVKSQLSGDTSVSLGDAIDSKLGVMPDRPKKTGTENKARKETAAAKKAAAAAAQTDMIRKAAEDKANALKDAGLRIGEEPGRKFSDETEDRAHVQWNEQEGVHPDHINWEDIPEGPVGDQAKQIWQQFMESELRDHNAKAEPRVSPREHITETFMEKRDRVHAELLEALKKDDIAGVTDEQAKGKSIEQLGKETQQAAMHALSDIRFKMALRPEDTARATELGHITTAEPGSPEHEAIHDALHEMATAGHNLSAVHPEVQVADAPKKDYDAATVKLKSGKYAIVVARHLLGAADRVRRAVFHETYHALDDAGHTEPVFSGEAEWQRGNDLHREIEDASRTSEWVRNHFDYPMKYNLSDSEFARELYAQVMSLHEMPEMRERMAEELPIAHGMAEDYSERAKSYGYDGTGAADSAESEGGRGREAGAVQERGAEAGGVPAAEAGRDQYGRGFPGAASEPSYARSQAARRASILSQTHGLVPEARRTARDVATNFANAAKKGFYAMSFGHDLADYARAILGMQKPTEAMNIFGEKGAEKNRRDNRTGQIAKDFHSLDKSTQDLVQRYLHDSVNSGKWGHTPDWKKGLNNHQVDKNMEGRLKAIGQKDPLARRVVEEVLKVGHEDFVEKRAWVQKEVNAIYDSHTEMAKAAGAAPEELGRIEEDRRNTLATLGKTMVERDGPYVADKRFGDHVVEGKSAAYRAAEAAGDKKLASMRGNHEHYWLSFERTKADALRARQEVESKYGWAATHEKEPFMHDGMGTDAGTFQKLREHALVSYHGDPDTAKAVVKLINELYMHSLGDGHAQQNSRKRLGVAGVKWNERMAGFVQQSLSDNHYITNLMHSDRLEKSFAGMREEVKSNRDNDLTGKRQDILNEFQKRRLAGMNSAPSLPWVNNAMRFTSAMKLLTSPGYYLQYMSQPITMAAPLLIGRHGVKAYAELTRGIAAAHEMAKKSGKFADSDWSSHPHAGERAMLDMLRKRGVVDIGAEQEYGRNVGLAETAGSRLFHDTMDKLSVVSKGLETHNRVGTALAAYRMEMRREGATHDSAVDHAISVVRQAYGDYSAFNAPRVMQTQNPMLKLAMQFKKFSLIHTALAGRLLHNAFGAGTKEERRMAAHALGFMAGHYYMLAGAMGLPAAATFAGMARYLCAMWNGNQDEPEDTNLWLERQIGDPSLARLVLHGPLGAAGVNATHRMGAGDILNLFPQFDKDPTAGKSSFAEDALAMAGPFVGSMLPGMAQGVGSMMKGDMYQGLLQFLPSGARDALKAYHMANQGLQDKHGTTLIQPNEADFRDIIGQAVGLNSERMFQRAAAQNEMREYTQHYHDRANTLRDQYVSAYQSDNSDKVSAVRDEWRDMQDKMKDAGMKPPPLSSLLRAPMAARKRERMVEGGVEYTKANRGLGRELGGYVE